MINIIENKNAEVDPGVFIFNMLDYQMTTRRVAERPSFVETLTI